MSGVDQFAVLLVLAMVRFAPLLMVPAFGMLSWIPGSIRGVVIVALGLIAVGGTTTLPAAVADIDAPVQLVLALGGEALVGLSFSLALVLPSAALDLGARMVDLQSGVAAATLFNPVMHATESLFGTLIQWTGMVTFFSLGLHLIVLRGIAASTTLVPLGAGRLLMQPATFLGLLSSQFLLGLMVVLPVMLGLFALDLGAAYASRSMPQANIYFVVLPLKLLASLLLLSASVRFAPALIERLYRDGFAAMHLAGAY